MSQGEAAEGFDKLDEFGVIREIEKTDERIKAIYKLHVRGVRRSSLIFVAPTHTKSKKTAATVHNQLRAQGLIEEAEQSLRVLRTRSDEASARGCHQLSAGQVIEFHRRMVGGFKGDELWQVIGCQGG